MQRGWREREDKERGREVKEREGERARRKRDMEDRGTER